MAAVAHISTYVSCTMDDNPHVHTPCTKDGGCRGAGCCGGIAVAEDERVEMVDHCSYKVAVTGSQ
eukprot:1137157-Pelagomonas_calceolata.AAC.2